jgi:hypothetical protein
VPARISWASAASHSGLAITGLELKSQQHLVIGDQRLRHYLDSSVMPFLLMPGRRQAALEAGAYSPARVRLENVVANEFEQADASVMSGEPEQRR